MGSADPLRSASRARRWRGKTLLIGTGLAIATAVAGIVLTGLLLGGQYATVQIVERAFTIDEDFTRVRKILVRTDATKQIVTMTGDSVFIDQQWNTVGAGLDGLDHGDLKWKLELHGTLVVRTTDPYIGEHQIGLNQDVKIDPDQVYSNIELARPTQRLLQYEMTTWFTRRSDGTTLVRQRLKQEIVTDAPWFAHFIADRRVHQSAERALVNQEQAIRRIVDENRDKRWLLLGH